MKSGFGWGRFIATSLLLAFVAIVIGLAVAWSFLPLDHTTISIDDETVRLSGIDGWRIAVVIAAGSAFVLIALIVGVLAVVFALLAAALSIVVALTIVIATLALVASPILVVAWAIWRLTRSTNDARPVAA
ncbi:MAG: hypothetical protein ABI460_21750 [Caldimonas sp.]